MRLRILLAVALVAAVVGGTALYFAAAAGPPKSASSAPLAPNFTLEDIYGENFTLSSYRNSSVVVIEFTSLSCSECKIVEQSLQSIYSGYNRTGHSPVQMISVFIEPQFGDSIPALRTHQVQDNITWFMAQDTPTLTVMNAYGVSYIPTVFIVDKTGHVVYDVGGAQNTQKLTSTISSALAGTAAAISIVTVSVFALAAIAGVTTFFSPCAFPMFPGYMSLYLGLNAGGPGTPSTSTGGYSGAMRRALSAGSVAALGMLIVFLAIGLALIYAAKLVGSQIPYLQAAVGVVLVGLGVLLLTNLQYWRIVTPLQRLWQRLRGRAGAEPEPIGPPADGRGLYVKLFSYGMGYAAAAAGCVAPVILSAVVAGMALGLVDGIVNILIYALTAAMLMVGVTVALAVAGKKYVNQLKAFTPVIKKVSSVALILVGAYLIYFYYTAWVL